MNENTQAEMYLFYLYQILTGEKQLESIEDAEIKELLQLAETMLAADFSVNSKMKDAPQILHVFTPSKENVEAVRNLYHLLKKKENEERLEND